MNRDPQPWLQAINAAGPQEKPSRCEEALEIWPAATEVWRTYVQVAEDPQSVLKRALEVTVDPKLCEVYLAFVKSKQPDQLQPAYEFVLDLVSFDPDSGAIWKQYIDFLNQQPVANDWEEQFRRDKVRKAYKRAVSLPLANVETLWRAYGQFESRISRVNSRKFIDERSPAYMKARSCVRYYQQLAANLLQTTMPSVEQSLQQAPNWHNYIQWEQSNPLEFDLEIEEQREEFEKRVRFAFRRATVCARWAAQLWFLAGTRLGPEFWIDGTKAMPESYLLVLKLAEHYEIVGDYEAVRSVLEKLADSLNKRAKDPTPAWAELARAAERMKSGAEARNVLQKCIETVPEPSVSLYTAAAAIERENHPLVLKIMSFAYSQFIAKAAHLGQQGLEFAKQYIAYLFNHNDPVNARAVFEKVVTVTNGQPLKALFDLMLHLEITYAANNNSSMVSVRKLEQRYATMFNSDTTVQFAKRFNNDSLFINDVPQLGETAASGTNSAQSLFKEDSLFAMFASSLPPPSIYDGPNINVPLLMKYIVGDSR